MLRTNHERGNDRSADKTPAAPTKRQPAPSHLPALRPLSAGRLRRLSSPGEFVPTEIAYGIQKWAIPDDLTGLLPDDVEAIVPLGHPCHYRMHFQKHVGVGHSEFCGLADGFIVHMSDVIHAFPYAQSMSAPNMLRIRIGSANNCEYASEAAALDLKSPGAAIIIEPPGQPPAAAVYEGHSVGFNVCMHRNTLKRLYAGNEQELPAVIQQFLSGTLERTVARQLPLSPTFLRCLEDLHDCDLEGHSRRLFIRSKAVEAICHAFKILGEEKGGTLDATAGTKRGVLKAQQILLENYVTPPSLDDLAHDVGLSRSSLCIGFRQIIGQTVFDYIADLRMKRALALLNQSDVSITRIAYEVGYSHPSSFSLAVQRRFGATPSELRQRRLSTT